MSIFLGEEVAKGESTDVGFVLGGDSLRVLCCFGLPIEITKSSVALTSSRLIRSHQNPTSDAP